MTRGSPPDRTWAAFTISVLEAIRDGYGNVWEDNEYGQAAFYTLRSAGCITAEHGVTALGHDVLRAPTRRMRLLLGHTCWRQYHKELNARCAAPLLLPSVLVRREALAQALVRLRTEIQELISDLERPRRRRRILLEHVETKIETKQYVRRRSKPEPAHTEPEPVREPIKEKSMPLSGTFRCEQYKASLSERSCVLRWLEARRNRKGRRERLQGCLGCKIGEKLSKTVKVESRSRKEDVDYD